MKFARNTKKKKIRPFVGFPVATEFNECAAIDLKEWTFQEKVWLINIVDHLTSDKVQLVSFIQKGKRL